MTFPGVSAVLSPRVSSSNGLIMITSSALSLGILVNKDWTSKLTMTSSGPTVSKETMSEKCFEFFTKEEVLPISGVMIDSMNLAI